MQALLFEMKPREGHEEHYFKHAAALRPHLNKQDGLICINRFRSVLRPGVILSHSLWRDEASIAKWRTHPQHNKSQLAGRNKHFEDYRLRISHVLTHAAKGEATRHWSDQGAYCASESRPPRFLAIVASVNEPFSDQGESFLSVNSDGTYVNILALESETAGHATMKTASQTPSVRSALLCLVSRDYGMFDRTEAPQYLPAVTDT